MKKCLILLLTVFLLGCTLPAMGETNLQQQVIDLSAELDRAYQNLTAAEVTLTQYEADQAQLLADNATLSQQVIDLSAELERAYQNLSAAEAALTQHEADQAQLLADNAALELQVNTLSTELEAVKTDRNVQLANATVLEIQLADLQAECDALAQQLSDLTAKLEAVQEQPAPADPVERKLTVPRKAPTVTPTEEPVVEEPVVAEITYDIFAEDDLGNLVKVAAVTDMEGFVHTEVEDGNYVDFIDTDVGDDEIYFMAFYATAEEGLAFDREVFAATSQTITFGENMQTTIAGMDVKYFYYEDTYATDYEEVIMRGASAYIQVGEGTCVSVNVDTYRWVSEPQMDWPQVDNLIKLAVESLRLPV